MIDQPTIDRILDAANIVDVVSEFVTLRKRGVNYVGLCPFHADKTPSFYVSPAKNICKCFACGEGGTAVHFIMKHEQISYFDALRVLAKKYNIEIQERELTDKEKETQSTRESMFIINSWAQDYFMSMLHEHVEGKSVGLRYFIERGFREDTIRKFQLGYSLDQWDGLYQEALRKGYKQEFLEKTGLVIAYDNGKVNDRFRGRVMFPVHSVSGKVVAFGGRILKKDEKTAKYMNSPESEIYHKSNELYGIYFAKQAIVRADKCFLVEGYTDVISMHQAGIENVVASSGTALTPGQIRMIHRFTNNITVLYDGDAAGIKAALRGIDLLLEEGMNIKVVLLPDGEDPDSFARKNNAAAFTDFIEKKETDFIRFKTELLLKEAGHDPMKRSALITDIIASIAIIPNDIARTVYIRECSSMMEMDERVILNQVNKLLLQKPTATPVRHTPTPPAYTNSFDSEGMPTPPDDIPPLTEEEIAQMENGQLSSTPPQSPSVTRSPYEVFELALLRYIVRYGEVVLYDYIDENEERVVIRVAEYIGFDMERDDLTFMTPLFKQMLDEASARCTDEGFIAHKYFLSHPDVNISRLAADLIEDKYQLSKYHSKFRELETEDKNLHQYVVTDLYALKDAYIKHKRKIIQADLKKAQQEDRMDEVMSKMEELLKLDKIKSVLSKQLGERIILKM
ncbi:DNA primase [Massilibacteroides sp.]|uniref:DNA primase n=1 Tax=Massilibacteroides sp. TaxID=2034766 RepID=UPI002618919D|nr:DNA primase [Massilibacteroides sp.]MDD4515054.1 DNA primase [Massilibacteroides sp.]